MAAPEIILKGKVVNNQAYLGCANYNHIDHQHDHRHDEYLYGALKIDIIPLLQVVQIQSLPNV